MAGGARGEAVVGTPEVRDNGGAPSEPGGSPAAAAAPALDARVATMPSFPPLGPPDVVYVRKRFRPVVGAPAAYGYYHFIRGADASSPAALASYVYGLLNAGLDAAGWMTGGSWEIAGATIHSYNALAGRDAVVEVEMPGGVAAYTVGPDGELRPATAPGHDDFWRETSVCATVRAIANVGEAPPYPCMRAVSPLPTPEAEDAFLAAAAKCIGRWAKAGTDRPGVAAATAANSRIADAISEYFLADARFARAQAFFDSDEVLVADPETGAHAARAANRAGQYEEAARITSTVLELNARAGDAWLAKSETLAAQGELPAAMSAAHKATECAPDDLLAWIRLAELYVTSGDYESALVALNSADMPPPPLDPYLRELVPNRKNITAPLKGGDAARSGAVRVLSQRLREERSAAAGRADELLAELPAKLMSKTEREVYAVLVKIQIAVGWDDLLAIRGRCFVMEADIARAAEADRQDVGGSGRAGGEEGGVSAQAKGAGNEASGNALDIDEDGERDGSSAAAAVSNSDGKVPPPGEDAVVNEMAAVSLNDDPNRVAAASSGVNGGGDDEIEVAKIKDGADTNGEATVLHFEPNWAKGGKGDGAANSQNEEAAASDSGEESDGGDSGDGGGLPISQRALDDIGKKVCKPWLDYLVTNLYEDLRALAVWNAEEHLHRKAAASAEGAETPGEAAAAALRVSAEEDVEAGITDSTPRVRTADEVTATTRRPPVDWLRRGELASRLQNTELAKTAFLVCMKVAEKAKLPNISAHINLMTIAASEGNCKPTLRCADTIMGFVDSATEYQAKRKSLDAYSETPPVVRNAIHVLVSKVGLNKVRNTMPSRMDVNHSRLEGLLLDAVVWKVHGYDS